MAGGFSHHVFDFDVHLLFFNWAAQTRETMCVFMCAYSSVNNRKIRPSHAVELEGTYFISKVSHLGNPHS